ncbi:MAG TPA: response regulator, partial [Polyangiaceae bacterium]
RGLEQGAIAFLRKPAEESALRASLQLTQNFLAKKVKQLLLVISDDSLRMRLAGAIGNSDVHTVQARTMQEALAMLARGSFDCLTLGVELSDGSAVALIRAVSERSDAARLPIIVFAAHEPTPNQLSELKQLGKCMLVQLVRSPEEFLGRAALFLHRPRSGTAGAEAASSKGASRVDSDLTGKKALIVDDDLRNVFAMTALLEQFQMEVCYAENGQQALDKLDEDDSIDVVLMDIMMPEMDGYEATRRIRQQPRFAKLPVIALTAKAMKGDREKCISAGTSDYITKPVDSDQLLSLLRVWLYEK